MKLFIYQICYSPETKQNIPEGFLALDNIANQRPDWREFWAIRNFLNSHVLSEDALYGFLSPKFSSKTGLDHLKIQSYLDKHYVDEDVVSFSPFWDLMAIFKNVFEQGDFFHPGLSESCQKFADSFLDGMDLKNSIMDSRNTIFCNYFLAKKEFWDKWLQLAEHLFFSAESNQSELGKLLNQHTTYGLQQLPMKVFVQERLVSICLLSNQQFKCLNYSPFNTGPSTTPFNRFFHEAVVSDALKRAYMQTLHPAYLKEFASIRDSIIQQLRIPE